MRQYRKYDWPTLLAEFEQRGLNQTQFAKEKEINPKYLSQKLKGESQIICSSPSTRIKA